MTSVRRFRFNGMCTATLLALTAWSVAGAAEKPSLRIFYTASVKGYIDQCGCRYNPTGGIERRATYLERSVDPSVPTLVLDAGDMIGEADDIGRMQTRYLFRAMKEMRYRNLGVGPRDFLYGMGYLRDTERQFGFQFTGANVLDDATRRPVFAPYIIAEVNGGGLPGHPTPPLRVGLVSVMGLDRPPLTTPTDPTLRLSDPVAAVRGVVNELCGQTDLIVVMAYTGQADIDTIRAIGGVDVVISARQLRIPPEWVSFSEGKVVGYSSFQGRGVGWIDLTLVGPHRVTRASGDLAMMSADIPNHERMMQLKHEFEEWKARASSDAR